jgi:hypothetical protein
MAQGLKTGGRQAGTPNKVTTAFKDAVRIVYEDIGGNVAFAAWARENPSEFYKIAARLIPTEIAGRSDTGITVIINRDSTLDHPQDVPTLPYIEH